jgi:hypothetical protein
MVAASPFNFSTTNAAGSFTIQNDGDIVGVQMDDPATRFAIRSGYVLSSETIGMVGGVGIYEDIPQPYSQSSPVPDMNMQCGIGRAISLTGTVGVLSGFTLFNQTHNAVTSPTNPVPTAGSLQTFNYVRLGSGARIAVAIDPSLVSLDGGLVGQQVSWDFNLQRLVPFVAAYPANVLTALSWGTANGGTVTGSTLTSHGIAVGDDFTLSGSVPAAYNGDFTALAGTTSNVLVFALSPNPGVETTLGTLVAGGGALACRIDRIRTGNSMVPVYNAATGLWTWNRQGSSAIITI